MGVYKLKQVLRWKTKYRARKTRKKKRHQKYVNLKTNMQPFLWFCSLKVHNLRGINQTHSLIFKVSYFKLAANSVFELSVSELGDATVIV